MFLSLFLSSLWLWHDTGEKTTAAVTLTIYGRGDHVTTTQTALLPVCGCSCQTTVTLQTSPPWPLQTSENNNVGFSSSCWAEFSPSQVRGPRTVRLVLATGSLLRVYVSKQVLAWAKEMFFMRSNDWSSVPSMPSTTCSRSGCSPRRQPMTSARGRVTSGRTHALTRTRHCPLPALQFSLVVCRGFDSH